MRTQYKKKSMFLSSSSQKNVVCLCLSLKKNVYSSKVFKTVRDLDYPR